MLSHLQIAGPLHWEEAKQSVAQTLGVWLYLNYVSNQSAWRPGVGVGEYACEADCACPSAGKGQSLGGCGEPVLMNVGLCVCHYW